ncbi:hypothetical protein DSO57_1006157 [Entomophthora muscae]|uniref:Uncharacterized protein n=1 Tax=Entomophthora muscae TaxID=34485 RepID=A0ACC2UTC6_9FUNG|nr:hypothetical protein DSO57_1006157 [Entomophthora muscae]
MEVVKGFPKDYLKEANNTYKEQLQYHFLHEDAPSKKSHIKYAMDCVNSLPPLALDCTILPRCTKKGPKIVVKPLNPLENLVHTVDERFLLAYPADSLPLVAPSWEETLVSLDYLLAWWCPLLKTIITNQSSVATSMLKNSGESQMHGTSSSQSDETAEIRVKLSSPPGPVQQNFSPSQLDPGPKVM